MHKRALDNNHDMPSVGLRH